MPPKNKFTREEIIEAALKITSEKGADALTARSLGEALGSSAKPIFGLFENMNEVREETVKAAERLYYEYMRQVAEEKKYPDYKSTGMAYIRFAAEQKELFKLLFMRDRTEEHINSESKEIGQIIDLIMKNTGLEHSAAYLLHLEMWIFVHGIASMIATGYLKWQIDDVSAMITDVYRGLNHRFTNKEE